MSGRAVLRGAIVAAAIALATVAVGWWGVALAAALWGVMTRGAQRSPVVAALGGALGWAALLVADAMRGPVAALVASLAGVMQLPGVVIVGVTLIFPAALAWSAAAVAGAVARAAVGRGTPAPPAPRG